VINLKICIVVPAHNEEKRIDERFEDLRESILKRYRDAVTIVVVDDGSTDKTAEVIRKYAKEHGQIVLRQQKNEGKGGALINGFQFVCTNYNPDIIGFVDADISYRGKEMIRLIEALRKNKDVDGVIASRYVKGSKVIGEFGTSRYVASRGYNALVRILFGIKIKDTQAGCKFFRGHALSNILGYMHLSDMCFDINLLYELKRFNHKVIEVPVTMTVINTGSKISIKKHMPKMFIVTVGYWITRTPLTKIIPNKWKGYIYQRLKRW
jgi:glycosyltransferase involved in cell wall biosynthesis